MRKISFNFVAVIGFLILIPVNVFATSGACAYHGGVDCGAGQSYDGSVICNDGWKDSSVNYSDMEVCKEQDTNTENSGCLMAEDYDTLVESLNSTNFSQKDPVGAQRMLSLCKRDINIVSGSLTRTNANKLCIARFGSKGLYDSRVKTCGCESGYKKVIYGTSKIGKCVFDKDYYQKYCVNNYPNSHATFKSETEFDGCQCDSPRIWEPRMGSCWMNELATQNNPAITIPSTENTLTTSTTTEKKELEKKAGLLNKPVIKAVTPVNKTTPKEIIKNATTTPTISTSTQIQKQEKLTPKEQLKPLKWYQKVFGWFGK